MVNYSDTQVQDLKDEITLKILSEMEKKSLSQGEVARLLGLDRRNVNKILRGTERGISLDQLVRIANGIGLKIQLKFQKVERND